MTKTRAFFVHLVLSAILAGALVVAFVLLWYPMPYFIADGGWQGLRLICGVDLALGPLLTLVVYRDWKPRRTLALDYAIIGVLQVTALGFGIWTTYTQRTVLVTFADGSFYTVDAQTAASLGPRVDGIRRRAEAVPGFAFAAMPEDVDRAQELRKAALRSQRALYLFDELLEDLSPAALEWAQQVEVDTGRLAENWSEANDAVRRFVSAQGGSVDDYVFFPVVGRYRTFLIAFRRIGAAAGGEPAKDGGVRPDGYIWTGEERVPEGRQPSGLFPRVSESGSRENTNG